MAEWEDKFRQWARPPSDAEEARCERTINMVREAIEASSKLNRRKVQAFVQGSYRNNTNVPRESDVDVGVVCYDTFFPEYAPNTERSQYGHSAAEYTYATFKNDLGAALTDYFGHGVVTRGNKAFDIRATGAQVEADVAPFFEHRRYTKIGHYHSGVELRPDDGVPPRIINWPEQHHENGVKKNNDTGRRYKSMVRVLKSLRNEMSDQGNSASEPITGFLIECLMWNVPNAHYGHATYADDLRAALSHLIVNTGSEAACSEWGEVSEFKYLFRPSQKWTRPQAQAFVIAAWQHVGFR